MEKGIEFTLKTKSNLFIGGATPQFEIGGIDLYTITDREGMPYIPASSFKGALRDVVRDFKNEESKAIEELYKVYLSEAKKNAIKYMEDKKIEGKERERVEKNYEEAMENMEKGDSSYLFGIKGFNNTPKLIFNDLELTEESKKEKNKFSIDAKNSIEKERMQSNPRTYKVARAGLVFNGSIEFQQIEKLDENEDAKGIIRKYITECLEKFNEGIYRIGNSKSRGYGRIEIAVIDKISSQKKEK